MCNFNDLNEDTKTFLNLFMQKAASSIGGTNYLLSLIEAIRSKHSPLLSVKTQVASNHTIIKWDKVIFKDKFLVLENIMIAHKESQERDYNILNEPNQKKKKKILNFAKTLKPIEFVVTPQNPNDGNGFSFGVFDTFDLDNDTVVLNPIFLAFFFCSVEFTKKAIKYDVV